MSFAFVRLVSIALLGCSTAVAADFQGLGYVNTGNTQSRALGISADGKVVVGESQLYAPDFSFTISIDAFRWTKPTGTVSLGHGGTGSVLASAQGANGDGSVIVGQHFPSYAFQAEAVRWNNGTLQPMGDHDGGSVYDSRAYAVSADGSTVVGSSGFMDVAFRWTQAGGWQNLVPTGSSGSANGVSADGSVVVGQVFQGSKYIAFRWAQATGAVNIGPLISGIAGANDASADGNAVTGYAYTGSSYAPFRWKPDTGLVFLGGGFAGTNIGRGISADGKTIVGELDQSYYANTAFIWSETLGLLELKPYLQSLGVNLTGWQLDVANDISDDGLTIVGTGRNPQGKVEAWVATIPEPSAILLTSVCAAFAFNQRKRMA